MTDQKSHAKAGQAAAVQEVSPTQSTHPPHNSMRGVMGIITKENDYPPRYAFFTSSELASSAPVPLRVMEPVSRT